MASASHRTSPSGRDGPLLEELDEAECTRLLAVANVVAWASRWRRSRPSSR